MQMIMSFIFEENMQTWTETIEPADMGDKKLCNVAN